MIATVTPQSLPAPLQRHAEQLAALGAMTAQVDGETVTLSFADSTAAKVAKNLIRPELHGFHIVFDPAPAAGRSGAEQALAAITQLPGVTGATMNPKAPLIINALSLEVANELADLLRPKINGRDVGFVFSTPPTFWG